jgi:hypothetical protein
VHQKAPGGFVCQCDIHTDVLIATGVGYVWPASSFVGTVDFSVCGLASYALEVGRSKRNNMDVSRKGFIDGETRHLGENVARYCSR